MRVNIGPHKSWFGPYQMAEKLLFWMDKHEDKRVHKFGMWLAGDKDDNDGNYEHHETLLYKVLRWIDSKKHRTVEVRIDKYDTWNMDSTLAVIVLPMLKQLKDTKHGAPFVDDEDVPDELKSTSAPPKENEWDTDENHFKRWDWTLDQIVWTFEQLQPDCDWEAQYHSGVSDWKFKKIKRSSLKNDDIELNEGDDDEKNSVYQMVDGPNHTHKWDIDGYQAHNAKINKGLILFGKYYRGLWD